ncbi:MtrAB system histidine kinase MtrB [Corynebacterium atypicum]|uniref:MtrAB system histidine kinase MtrB n=1 Tax=Corynebacterium atypicum TaxID=191610 RepID=UPI000ADFDC6A|nr:MtrAB system histidine kinase MtrB [Corynebacterium atypicum]
MWEKLSELQAKVAESWRTSLQVRVIGSIIVATTIVMVLLGAAMVSVVTQQLVDAKIDTANSEIDRARIAVEEQITAASSATSTQSRLNSARSVLSSRASEEETRALYEPVLLVANQDGSVTTAPEGYRIPEKLRRFVDQDQISYQFTDVNRTDGSTYPALVVGSPTDADIPGLQVYLVLSMENDQETMALMRGLISAAAVVLIVLLVGIAWLLAQQVITPVHSASRIAERLASGHLRERMSVEGEDEMARLAMSFNSMAESLSHQIRQLKEYGDLQRQFTSDVSHELRTPLTTVRMAADMIAMKADSFEPGTKRATELLVGELDRFEDLLTDLLEISRHDAGVADLNLSQFDIKLAISEACRQVEPIAEEVGTRVELKGPADPIRVTADSRRVERILRNLTANAVDHSEGNPVQIDWAANEDAVAVRVTDHGVGLKEGQEELVFNRFWRADPSRVRHSGGTGLGLAIAQEDAHLHGGHIDAIGTPSVGSQFRLVLPLTANGAIEHAPLELVAPSDVAPALPAPSPPEQAPAGEPSDSADSQGAPATGAERSHGVPDGADANTSERGEGETVRGKREGEER